MVRLATKEDLPEILKIYEYARQFMRENGNPSQWGTSRPKREVLEADIEKNNLYIIEDYKIVGVFAFIIGDDPTYNLIEDGKWASNAVYGTIHRVASAEGASGIFKKTIEYCKSVHPYIRIDTHEDNLVMRYLIEHNGFKRSGIIYTYDGSPRIVYELLP